MGFTRCSDLAGRFSSYGLDRHTAVELQAEILKWLRNSGPEWTVKRLKSLKQDIVRIRGGLDPLTWVKKNKSGGWYGVVGRLRKLSESSLRNFEMVVNCFACYSSFIPSRPTEKHVESMKSSVSGPKVGIPETLLSDIAQHARSILGSIELGPTRPLATFQGRVSTKAPVWGGRSVNQYEALEQELKWIEDPYHQIFLNRHYESYGPVLEGFSNLSLREPLRGLSAGAFYLSEMGPYETVHRKLRPPFQPTDAGSLIPLTKDGGWKVRWIASPYRIHQMALNPLGSALFKTLRDLPWDCTFDQTKPYKHVQEHLRSGGTAFAVDLSSATDHFPLDLQVSVLMALFPQGKHQVELFRELSRSAWDAREYGVHYWTNGQPMGLYPSFPAFALTHGVLLDYLSGGVPGRFFVLGDDVIILHRPTYEAYIATMDVLGCPFSPSKTIVSDRVTEFAGKIITPERIVSAYKWRDVSSKNFMDLMRTFGQRFRTQLRPRERRVYDLVGRLLEPYGCNHSSGSSEPLERVVFETELFKSHLPESREAQYVTSFLHRLVDLLKPDQPGSLFSKIDPAWFREQARCLDERASAVFQSTPFCRFRGDFGALSDILAVNDDFIDLPTAGPRERKDRSLLEWFEEVLGLAE